MKARLLFMRYFVAPLQKTNNTSCGCSFLHHSARGASRSGDSFLRRPSSSLSHLQPPTVNRSHSSSSSAIAASFKAPIPPESHGHPVFPHIDFSNQSNANNENNSLDRNSDPNAVFVISGASRGIGLQFVISLLERTQGKIVACCRSPSTAHQLNEIASQHTDRVEVVTLDVENQSTIDNLGLYLTKKYQRIDALFNVAGILGDGGKSTPGPERTLASIEREWFEKSLSVNVIGPTMLIKALCPLMRTKGKRKITIDNNDDSNDGNNDGKQEQLVIIPPTNRPPTIIINLSARVGSISDNQLGGWYSYRSSKSALNQMTRTMAHELHSQGSHVIALHPGTTNTDLSKPFQKNVAEERLFPVEFTVEKFLDVVDAVGEENSGGFYDWAGMALPF